MKATFFNQPWLERKYRPGTRLMLQGKYQARNRFRVQYHAPTGEQTGAAGDVATYPATEGLSTTQIAALVREHRGALADVVEPLPARLRAAGALARPRRRARARRTSATTRAAASGSPSRSCCCCSSRCCAAARCGARRPAPRRSTRPATLTRALARRLAAVHARPTTSATRWTRSTRDLAAGRPMQRLLMGEVGSGKTVVALYAMLRAVEHGAQAALMAPTETLAEQHFATLQRLMPGELRPGRAAHRLDAPRAAAPTCSASSRSGELQAAGRHARADRGRRRVRPPRRRRRRRAAPLRRQPAPRARPQGAGRARAARAAHDGDADPAHARADRLRRPRRHGAARAARRAAARSRRTSPRPSASARAPTSASARSCAPAARRSSSARWSRSPRRCRRAPRPPSTSGSRATELRDFRVVLLHGQMKPREKQEAMARVRRRRRRRARRHDGDRGRDRRPERVRDARRGRRALRHLAAAPAARPDRARRARVGLPAVRPEGVRRACARSRDHRDGFKLAEIDLELRGEGEMLGTRQSGLAQFRVARLPEDAELLDGARRIGARAARGRSRSWRCPSTRCSSWAVQAAYGAEALDPIPA